MANWCRKSLWSLHPKECSALSDSYSLGLICLASVGLVSLLRLLMSSFSIFLCLVFLVFIHAWWLCKCCHVCQPNVDRAAKIFVHLAVNSAQNCFKQHPPRLKKSTADEINIFNLLSRVVFSDMACLESSQDELTYLISYSNRISPWFTEFGPLPWQAKQTVSTLCQLKPAT